CPIDASLSVPVAVGQSSCRFLFIISTALVALFQSVLIFFRRRHWRRCHRAPRIPRRSHRCRLHRRLGTRGAAGRIPERGRGQLGATRGRRVRGRVGPRAGGASVRRGAGGVRARPPHRGDGRRVPGRSVPGHSMLDGCFFIQS
uniref:Uncharacterized protein n=1 Tax=Aegilops tauschii subsp. strangulata TaxID=200361 RepID=A0A452YCK2_AEGTS